MIPLASAQEEEVNLSISCTCSTNVTTWINDYVIPTFTDMMAEQGKTVTVELLDLEFSDEEYREQIALDFSLGQGSDIGGFDGFWSAEFVDAGLILPLNEIVGDVVDEWEGWDHISPGVQEVLSFGGERYGIAVGTDVRLVFYRRDLFEQAGIEVPWQPTSWQDILDASRQLQAAGIEYPLQIDAGTFMGEATTMQGYLMLLLGAGQHMYDFEEQKWVVSSPAILDVLNLYQTVYIDEMLGNAALQLEADGRDLSFEAFQTGNIGIYLEGDYFWRSVTAPSGSYGIENRNDVVGWAKLPAIEPGQGYREQDFVTISGGTGWVLNPNTPNPAEAWELLTFLSSKEANDVRQTIEPRISFRDDVSVANDEILTSMADTLLPLTTIRPLLPEYPQISFEAQLMTERVVTGEMTPEEAMQAYDDAVTSIVGDENVIRLSLD